MLAAKLFKYICIHNYIIKFVNHCQLFYSLIYSLDYMKFKILKAYIKNNIANNFIRPFQASIKASIFFNENLNNNLRLYDDYQDFVNLIVKNKYLLSLVRESLNQFT